MTGVSVLGPGRPVRTSTQVGQLRRVSCVARPVHCWVGSMAMMSWVAMPVTFAAQACVLPPALSLDQPDAGADSPPLIVSVRGENAEELTPPGPLVFQRGAGSISLTLEDNDLGDTLFVRVFVDYHHPDDVPARAACSAAPATQAQRATTCVLNGLCNGIDAAPDHLMEVEVYDRAPLEDGSATPLYRAIPPDGRSTSKSFFVTCQDPT